MIKILVKENTKKVISIVGARPQFIKTVLISKLLRKCKNITEILVNTGQHYDDNLSKIFFRELGIPVPDYNLKIGSGSHGKQTGAMLSRLESVICQSQPDLVLVYGDTNSTLAGSLAAAKLKVPIAHIEAGLRSFNRAMPEEINRVITDHLSHILFAPTANAATNLLHEGIPQERIFIVGDIMYDSCLYYSQRAEKISNILKRLCVLPKGYILSTVHRAENTDDPKRLYYIFEALNHVKDILPVVLPLHPRTRARLRHEKILVKPSPGFLLLDPVSYLDMIMLEKNAFRIITDSGGVQKEALFHGVPCITLREETEWLETIKSGWNCLLPPGPELKQQLKESIHYPSPGFLPTGIYGNGDATQKIVTRISELVSAS